MCILYASQISDYSGPGTFYSNIYTWFVMLSLPRVIKSINIVYMFLHVCFLYVRFIYFAKSYLQESDFFHECSQCIWISISGSVVM